MLEIYYEVFSTPLGEMHAAITDEGLAMFEFPIEDRIASHTEKLAKHFQEVAHPPSKLLHELKLQLNQYFEGTLTHFDIPLHLIGSDFQCQVWNALLEVPYGKTMSYLELAQSIGNPDGVRAVAQANGQNRIPIIVPCHRVVGSDGKLRGYSGGMWRKDLLLNKEQGQSRLIF